MIFLDIEAGEGGAGVLHPVLLVTVAMAVGGIAAGAQDVASVLNLTEDQELVTDFDLVLVHKEVDTLLIEEGQGQGTGIHRLPDLLMQILMTTKKTRVIRGPEAVLDPVALLETVGWFLMEMGVLIDR